MSKKKVHELAKQLNMNTKNLITELERIGVTVKSHLSSLSEEDMNKIEKSGILHNVQENNSNKPQKNDKTAKNEKAVNPIIIRREIQVVNQDKKEVETKVGKKDDIGVVQRNKKKDFNIISRDRSKQKTQVGSIADLFKKAPATENQKKEEAKQNKQKMNTYDILEKKLNDDAEKEKQNREKSTAKNNKVAERKQFNNSNKNNNQNKNHNNTNQTDRRNNNASNRGQNNFNANMNNNRNKQRKIENDIKNVMSQPFEKEQQKEYMGKVNKEKPLNDENKKVNSRHNRGGNDDFNMGKIKDLQKHKSLSGLFNDSDDGMLDYYDLSNNRRNKKSGKKSKDTNVKRTFEKNKIFELTNITIPEYITVKDLAEAMKKTSSEVIKKLLGLGIMATINQELDFDTAFLIAQEFNITAEKQVVVSDEDILFDDSEDREEDLKPRAPIVVVMGHVDHGKTSLLDAIRSTNVTEKEAGGITQHIGAYMVKVNGRDITFLDTPGHEAFTSMRARGAQVTDIAILVVAADDGIMPQTVEAINHAKAAEVPIIVAINKMDKEGANVQRIKEALTEYELVPEEWGGNTICVPISAKNREGIDDLLEMVLLVADMHDLRANPDKQSKGTVIESRMEKNRGVITTLLVQRGTLNIGDTIVLGNNIGKIRAMTDDKGKKIKAAGPSTPVEIIGLPEVTEGGEIFYEVENEKVAKHLIEQRRAKQREEQLRADNRVTLDDLFNKIKENNIKDLNIIVKADVQGSVEALKDSLIKLSNEEVKVKVIHANVGPVSVSDVTLAKVANAIIIGFNVRPDITAKNMIATDKVDVRLYSVIYDAIDDVKNAMKGMLAPTYEEEVTGTAEVRNTFKVSNVGTIAGCYVLDGKIVRNGLIRLIRDGVVIYSGKIASLKRFKDDVKEAASGYECGIQIEDYNDVKEQDQIECYIMKEVSKE